MITLIKSEAWYQSDNIRRNTGDFTTNGNENNEEDRPNRETNINERDSIVSNELNSNFEEELIKKDNNSDEEDEIMYPR